MGFLISINEQATGKLPQGDPRWSTFNDSFRHAEMEVVEIANAIYAGHAYAGLHQGRRCLENFLAAQHIAVDMDSGDERSSMETLIRHPLVRMYGGLLHTTASHKADAPRARVIFFLDQPITDAQQYQAAAKFLAAQFDGSDPAVTDASRFFYGAQGCDIWLDENVFPLATLRRYWRLWSAQQAQEPRDGVISLDAYRKAAQGAAEPYSAQTPPRGYNLDALLNPVRFATNGNRNVSLNRQAFLAGKDVKAGRISEAEAVEHLLRAALSVGLDEREALRTIKSGMAGGNKAAV